MNLISAHFEKGQKKKGVKDGCNDLRNIISKYRGSSTCREIYDEDYESLYRVLRDIPNYILLGGDHSIGQSSVASSIYKVDDVKNLYVIWIDAHGDINTYESSLSKNLHGMPLSGIVGYEKPWFEIKSNLPLDNLLYFGIRDLDLFEREKIEYDNIFYASDFNELKDEITMILMKNKNARFHVSFDVDSLDPKYLDSTGCLAEGGLHPDDIINTIELVRDKMIAIDIVEYNPMLGNREKSLETLDYIIEKLKL